MSIFVQNSTDKNNEVLASSSSEDKDNANNEEQRVLSLDPARRLQYLAQDSSQTQKEKEQQ
jgi:hypothetical protein